jgi:signal transduction histidine kinase
MRDEGGVAMAGNPLVTKTRAGMLWFAARGGVLIIDPTRIPETTSPPVRIERVTADDRLFDTPANLQLPVNTSRMQIDYTSLTFSPASATQFRYKLDGFDRDWVDAGLLRQAFYTNLPPRHYTFRVAASQDGVWNEAAHPLEFSVLPAFYQTVWFYVVSSAALLLIVWGAWRWRLLAMRRRYSLVLAERARLGRDIHDTLLQGMVGVALQLHGMSETLSPEEPLKARLDRARDRLEHYIRETRTTIWDLRSPTLETRDLASALRHAGDTITTGSGVTFELTVTGRPVRCDARVEEHLLRIAHEAIANALRHADPTRISVDLAFDVGTIRLRVMDDGHGFDPADAIHKSTQSWGLTSMRERAQQIGADFRCTSRENGGTEIETVAPLAAA